VSNALNVREDEASPSMPISRRLELTRARFIKRALNQIFRRSIVQLLRQCQGIF